MENQYDTASSYTLRWVKKEDAAELINLYHLALTALSGAPCGRYERMLWASRWFAQEHSYVSVVAAYKDLDGLLS